ncbi:MAG: hypothetical protein GY719_02320 [bacterium]|nr:hypothetical protein [bacterium]
MIHGRRRHCAAVMLAVTLAVPAVAGASADDAGEDAWHRGAGGLLPLQDRVGNPVVAAAVEETLRQALAARASLVDPVRLRDAQRRLRIRDASQASPEALARMAEETGAGWFFSATVHQATESLLTRASQAFVSDRPGEGLVPQITLSARVIRLRPSDRAGAELGWAGFEAASGLDGRRLLGLGVIDDPEILGREVAERLVETFEREVAAGEPTHSQERHGRARPDHGGFLRRPISVQEMGSVALVPFGSVTERQATRAGETVSELALAVLYRSGARLVLPGRVNQILRGRGVLLRGEVDAEARAALRSGAGADSILTGTVEAWEVGGLGAEPEPRIAFSARLIDTGSGGILWWNGQDRTGWDRSRLLGTGRIHAAGLLAEDIMWSLVAGLVVPRKQGRAGS